jgi:signal transduction histidine kinase
MSNPRTTFADAEVLQQHIETEQVALMCRLSTLPLFGSIFVGAIIAYTVIEEAGWRTTLAWYIASLCIMVVRWRVAYAFLQRPREYAEVLRWRYAMLALVALFGATWSIPAGFLQPKNPEMEIVMSVVFIGATATGIGSLAAVRHAYALLLIPFTLPYAIHQFILGGSRTLNGLAFLLYVPIMIAIANRQTHSLERQLRLAIENKALAEELRRERDRVNEINHELQVQVEQHRQSAKRICDLNRNLETQAVELRTANDDLEGFAYSVSHDLRAPLRAIDGFSRLLAEEIGNRAGDAQRHAQHVRESIVRMTMLIDDLLAFARCSRQPLETVDLPMEELVQAAVVEARAAHDSQQSPEITIEALPHARGDRGLMLQVWVNLIDNAIKYSSKVAQPRILVRGREQANQIVYEVIDNGVGFDSRYGHKLFGVFQRLHGLGEYPGTGVGLAIIRRIIMRHGGEVWATSEINQGATFGFTLPASRSNGLSSNVA